MSMRNETTSPRVARIAAMVLAIKDLHPADDGPIEWEEVSYESGEC